MSEEISGVILEGIPGNKEIPVRTSGGIPARIFASIPGKS